MRDLSRVDITNINSVCLKEGEHNRVLSFDRLDSSLSNQYQPYDSDEKVIASLYKSLIINHAFENGNKRTAVIAMAYLANLNEVETCLSDVELCDLTYRIASEGGSLIEVDEIASILFKNTKKATIVDSIEAFSIDYCREHKWLIDKLGE